MLCHYAGVRTINKMAVGEMCVYAKNKKTNFITAVIHVQ
jgi:hypothetical protein